MKKYFNFYGAASRQQHWAVFVILTLISIVGSVPLFLTASLGIAVFVPFSLGFLLFVTWCFLATSARRCRDAGFSPWWSLLYFIPYANVVFIIVAGVLKTKPGGSTGHGDPLPSVDSQ
jgi:uncharacterized membrane protein YhaH (DUF805 family)